MKTIFTLGIATLCLSLATIANAAKPGAYIGAGLGLSKLTNSNALFSLGESKNKTAGAAGRAFVGYNFNEYLGLEAGIARYASVENKSTFANLNTTITNKMNAIDVVAKAYLPVQNGLNFYALGGVARVNNNVDIKNSGLAGAPKAGSSTVNKYRPIYGLGASYDIPETQITTNLEVSRIQGTGDVKTNPYAIPSANMVSLNIAYNFG